MLESAVAIKDRSGWNIDFDVPRGQDVREAALEILTVMKTQALPGKTAPMMTKPQYDKAIRELKLTELVESRSGELG